MARKPTEHTELVADAPLNEDALNAVQNAAAAVQGMSEERDLVNQLLGQAQMADAFAKFSVTVTSSKLAYVKENKLYRALAGKDSGNGYQFSGTWEEFCGLLGMSREKADMDISNLRSFGEEALESMSRMGIGYRELRQYRRLPDDQKAALIEVAKLGDKESFVELAEEIISKHSTEKAELKKRLETVEADYDAQGEVLRKKSAELDRTKQELEKASRRIQTLQPDEAAKELRQEVAAIAFEAEADISGKLREAFAIMHSHSEESGTDHRSFQAQLIAHLEGLLRQLRDEFQLPEQAAGAHEFGWMQQLNQQAEG